MQQSNQTRFVIKFNNGIWKTFDTERFEDVEVFLLRKDAEARLKAVFG